jgi:hypothetical protein
MILNMCLLLAQALQSYLQVKQHKWRCLAPPEVKPNPLAGGSPPASFLVYGLTGLQKQTCLHQSISGE